MKRTFTNLFLVLLGLGISSGLFAQSDAPLDIALRYLQEQGEAWKLSDGDLRDVELRDRVYSRHNGTTHFYFNQRYAGIELYNAINGVHVQEGEVKFATNRFQSNVSERVNATEPSLSPAEAIEAAATHLGLVPQGQFRLKGEENHRYTFTGGAVSNSDINVQLVYQSVEGGKLRLAWNLALDMPNSTDYWSLRVDALSGLVLDQNNWTVYCSFDAPEHRHGSDCGLNAVKLAQVTANEERSLSVDSASYNVYALPIEAPNDGERSIVTNPADSMASPFGWHDTDGVEGPEFTITRGNNVHAYLDASGDDTPMGDEPDGGADLNFDFPIDLELAPEENQEAAVTQLFYLNNVMHDIAYAYGFDEEAGNFQANNYGRGGLGNDFVNAHAQDGGGQNNANFSVTPDGMNGRMQMYLWNINSSTPFSITSPQSIVGGIEVGTADFGAPITETPVSGQVIEATDGTIQGTLGCNELVNAEELDGKVALIDRGLCEFSTKVLNAQNAGAVGAIICNFEDALIGMAAGATADQVNIPSVFVRSSDCQRIKQFLGSGVSVTFQLPEEGGDVLIDGTLDNGIIAHEYGHGISIRLTGGASAAGCLSNDEQMGEGWSDFFTLVTTAKPEDTGATPRGIGTYAQNQSIDGRGIRRQPYSTDMTVNNQVLDDIVGTAAPHPLGEVWTAVTWDLYWALVEEYGWDPDLVNGTGGNNIAIQLVMDGMKLQSCLPGFEDGRNAILAADEINYDGAHQCLIWEVFARRGMGFFMNQNSSEDRNDNLQNFDMRPDCIRELKIEKEVTRLIQPGDPIEVTLTVTNHKLDPVTGVIVEDIIPEGTAYMPGSANGAEATAEAGTISFEIETMESGDVLQLSYTLMPEESIFSARQLLDDMEDGIALWFFDNVNSTGSSPWEYSQLDAFSGEYSWYVPNLEEENDQVLFLREPIQVTGERPVLRFTHRFVTERRFDGGFVQYSTDGGTTWLNFNEEIIRNTYNSPLAYGTIPIPNLQAFSGNSEGWITTYIDLSDLVGEEFNFRFRFGSDLEVVPSGLNPGWFIDDIEIMDMVNFNAEACVMSNEGDMACAAAEEAGTIVDSAVPTSVSDPLPAESVRVFPNPATDLLNVALDLEASGPALISIVGVDGRLMQERQLRLDGGEQIVPFNLTRLPAGMYFVKVQAGSRSTVEKIVLK